MGAGGGIPSNSASPGRIALFPSVVSAGRREQYPNQGPRKYGSDPPGEQSLVVRQLLFVHSFLLRYGCRLCVRQRGTTTLYNPSESATESLHVPSFLFLIATFVGLAPIMVYRSLGVPLPVGLKGHRDMYVPPCVHRPLITLTGILSQPWIIGSRSDPANASPPPDGDDNQTPLQDHETIARPKTIVTPKAHLHPSTPVQLPTPTTSPDLPTPTIPRPTPES